MNVTKPNNHTAFRRIHTKVVAPATVATASATLHPIFFSRYPCRQPKMPHLCKFVNIV